MLFALMCRLYDRLNEMENEKGATAVEYGIMVALIAAVIITIVATLGGQVRNAFQKVVDALPAGA